MPAIAGGSGEAARPVGATKRRSAHVASYRGDSPGATGSGACSRGSINVWKSGIATASPPGRLTVLLLPPARRIDLDLAQERRRLLRRHGVDVKSRAPLEAGHARQPRDHLHVPV